MPCLSYSVFGAPTSELGASLTTRALASTERGARARARGIATTAHVTICGHVHRPYLYSLGEIGKLTAFRPVEGAPVPLAHGRQWLAVVGAVGQPRDGNPAACYAIFDTTEQRLVANRLLGFRRDPAPNRIDF